MKINLWNNIFHAGLNIRIDIFTIKLLTIGGNPQHQSGERNNGGQRNPQKNTAFKTHRMG